MLIEISDAIIGLKEEIKRIEPTPNKFMKNNHKWREIEEEKNKVRGEIEKRIDSVEPQEDRHHGGIMYEQTRAPQSSSVGGKK